MSEYWITTHWPTPATEPAFSRHVYVKAHSVSLPKPGDFVFFRESTSAKVKGQTVRTAILHHRGHRAQFDLPRGTGGIVGTATVNGALRSIRPDDVVFEYGDLREWSIVPCRDFQSASLTRERLRALLDVKSLRFLSLWRMPDDEVAFKLLKALSR